jgi:hypothetical protein
VFGSYETRRCFTLVVTFISPSQKAHAASRFRDMDLNILCPMEIYLI